MIIIEIICCMQFRQVITPKSPIWTHLMTNEVSKTLSHQLDSSSSPLTSPGLILLRLLTQLQYAHLPTAAAIAQQKVKFWLSLI
jgi:hypothetical protein